MIKIYQKFIRVYCSFAIFLLFIVAVWSYSYFKNRETNNIKRSFKAVTSTILLDKNISYKKLEELSKIVDARVTIINNNRVINGVNIDFSDLETLKSKSIYEIKRVDNSYLILSVPLSYVENLVYVKILKLEFLVIFCLVVLFFILRKIFMDINRDFYKIENNLNLILKKNYIAKRDDRFYFKESELILKKLEKISKRFKKSQKQKERYTKRIREIKEYETKVLNKIGYRFKIPIASILGYIDIIKNKNLDKKFQYISLNKIENSAKKLNSLVETFILLTKLENNSIKPNKIKCNLKELILEAKSVVLKKRDNSIEIDCKDIDIFADRELFREMFINLFGSMVLNNKVLVECNSNKVNIIDYNLSLNINEIKKIQEYFSSNRTIVKDKIDVRLIVVNYILKLHNIELEIDYFDNRVVFSFKLDSIKTI